MTSTISSGNTLANDALRSEIAWNAILREVRSRNSSVVGVVAAGDLSLTRKKRSRFDDDEEAATDMSLTGATSEKKVRCQPGSSSGTSTFLDLSPPSSAASLTSPIRFTFGKHYTKISLPTTVKASCGCVVGSKFDVFSAYRCPCKSRSMSHTKTTPLRPTPSKGRKYDAI